MKYLPRPTRHKAQAQNDDGSSAKGESDSRSPASGEKRTVAGIEYSDEKPKKRKASGAVRRFAEAPIITESSANSAIPTASPEIAPRIADGERE